MGRQGKEMDAESLQRSGRRRGRCLDVFLVVSVIFLLVAVAALTAGGVLVLMRLSSGQETPRAFYQHQRSEQTGDTQDSSFKAQNFAYLEASLTGELRTSTMELTAVEYGTGTSVGSNFLFDPEQHSLKPKQAGTYFIYINLTLTCTSNCTRGHVSVHVGDKLTCQVTLPDRVGSAPVSRKCWTVSQLHGEKLLTQMTVEEGLQNWKLDPNSSGLGMFLVG